MYHQQECPCHVVGAERGQGEGLGRVVLQEIAVVQVPIDKDVDETALVKSAKKLSEYNGKSFYWYFLWENTLLRSC